LSSPQHTIADKLDKARKELLDLGLRNPLINYRVPKARGLEIVGENPVAIFRILAHESKTMSFLPAENGNDEELFNQPEEPEDEKLKRQTDLWLQTPYDSARLQSRLLATYQTARTFIEEQGVNALYLAVGMLNWYEAESSQAKRRAPLILIPVELARASAKDRFRLNYNGEEMGFNLSLAAKLKGEFGVELPPFPEIDDLDIPTYFAAVERAIAGISRWSVDHDAIALNLFSFAKFLMYRDLDDTVWDEDSKPSNHPLIKALLQDGFREPPMTITEDDHLDQHVGPLDLAQVVDADGSQVLAMIATSQGRNMIIQGPPGTGKSQTITNLIADAIDKRKRVLFVAEKMAALEVVKRRLDKIGLGDACLELHSHNTKKKALLAELGRTFNLGRPVLNNFDNQINLLKETRQKLNGYSEAVNTAIGRSGVTPHDAYGEMLKLRRQRGDRRLPQFNLSEMDFWSGSDYQHRRAVVSEMQSRLTAIGALSQHPFRGSRLKILMPSGQQNLEDRFLIAWQAAVRLRVAAKGLADLLGLAAPQVRKDAEVLCRAARRAIEAPGLKGIRLRTGDWQARRDEIGNLLKAGLRLSSLHSIFDAVLIPEAWEQDLLETRQHLVNYGRKWWRLISGDYRRARNRLDGLCRANAPREIDKKIKLIDAVLEARRCNAIMRQHQSLGEALFGAQWQGEKSDWSVLTRLFEWIIALYKDIGDGQIPEGILIFLAGDSRIEGLESRIVEVEQALNIHLHHTREVIDSLDLDENLRFGPGMKLEDQALVSQEQLFGEWSAKLLRLHEITAFNLQAETFRKEGLSELLEVIDSWPAASLHLVKAFEWNWWERLLTRAFLDRPALAAFHGASQANAVDQFRQLDQQVTEHNRLRLTYGHWKGLPQQDGGGQIAVLRRQMSIKSRHLPIRKLMQQAGNAIQAIKPVFMMSPLSIANYLAADSASFDLIIFDEASQVKPVDAFGAMLRGKQVVVVGDSKQMPPTSFFDSLIQGSEDDDEDGTPTADVESILGLCKAQGMPERMLRWHYRSKHESLIAVSNHEFYENRLVIFPSVDKQNEALGLVYRYLPHTVYDRGKSSANPQEAEAVAREVMEFARAQLRLPADKRQSLLVAAFSMAQKRAISERLEMLRRQDSSCEEFFASGHNEPFDVKNLENVQGDERDVIFISIGYGRDQTGQASMNFGPLNRDGGERRLNVLITRARRRCDVFTNLTDQDIDLNRTNARGVRALKSFLAYARTGKMDITAPTGRGTDSPFEDEVKAALESSGYEVVTQVGTAGFFIDLAIVNPEKRGSYLIGIECDGASYHSSRSARDRDRLRQQVLEGLGWRIHRIWSTDWFRDPDRELKRVTAAINEAQMQGLTNTASDNFKPDSGAIERVVAEPRDLKPFRLAYSGQIAVS
jgi:very-short-patch-repair endonuclease